MLALLAAPINQFLSVNRLGRGNAALFLVLSFGAIGSDLSLPAHLILGMAAALWYNGLNDYLDLEIDRGAYVGKSGHRKVLLNGAMGARELWFWLVVLLLASAVLLVRDVGLRLDSLALFGASIGCSVVYNLSSKHLKKPSIAKSVFLDALVGGPFYFYYASLAVVATPRPDPSVIIAVMGSLLGCGLYGNYIFAAKDLSTDATRTTTLPMMLGTKLGEDGRVKHSSAGKAYLVLHCALLVGIYVYSAWKGHWFGLAALAALVACTIGIYAGRVTERGHKKIFIFLSNFEMVFLLSLHLGRMSFTQTGLLVALAGAIVLLNVAYFHDAGAGRPVMLRL